MGWARLDDGYSTHPKLVTAGLEATGLDARAISHCAKYETDGFLSEAEVSVLAGDARKGRSLAVRLHEVRRWHQPSDPCRCLPEAAAQSEPGWWVHDYLVYNFSHEQLEKKREQERRRKAGKPGHGGTDSGAPPPGSDPESGPLPRGPSRGRTSAPPSRPVPSSDVDTSSSNHQVGEPAVAEEDLKTGKPKPEATMAEAWQMLAEHDRQRYVDGGGVIDHPAGFLAKAMKTRRDNHEHEVKPLVERGELATARAIVMSVAGFDPDDPTGDKRAAEMEAQTRAMIAENRAIVPATKAEREDIRASLAAANGGSA